MLQDMPTVTTKVWPVSIWRILMPLVAAFYFLIYWQIYKQYLYPVFGYANYGLLDRSGEAWAITFFLAIVPVVIAPLATSAASVLSSFMYVLYYVPAVLAPFFSLHRAYGEVFQIQLALAAGMVGMFVAARGTPGIARVPISKARSDCLLIFSLFLTAVILFTYRSSLRIVSFYDVYEVRSAASDLGVNPLVGYAIMWQSFCLIPFLLMRGWICREWRHIAAGLFACLVIYAANGAKIAALTPPFVFCSYFLAKRKLPFLASLLLLVSITSFLIIAFVPDYGLFLLLKGLVFERTLGTPGNLLVAYYEVFPKYGLTHFSQINAIQSLFGGYPYGSQSLGQVVSKVYFGASDANFNAGFWAMDGIASFGIPGLYFIGFVMAAFFRLLAVRTARLEPAFAGAWISGLAVSLISISFFTSLTSSGGLLFFVFFGFLTAPQRKASPATMDLRVTDPV